MCLNFSSFLSMDGFILYLQYIKNHDVNLQCKFCTQYHMKQYSPVQQNDKLVHLLVRTLLNWNKSLWTQKVCVRSHYQPVLGRMWLLKNVRSANFALLQRVHAQHLKYEESLHRLQQTNLLFLISESFEVCTTKSVLQYFCYWLYCIKCTLYCK